MDAVVDYQDVLKGQFALCEYVQIFDVDFRIPGALIVNRTGCLSKETVLEQSFLGVYVVDNRVCKPLLRSREQSDFKMLVSELKTFFSIRPNAKQRLVFHARVRIEHCQLHLRVKRINVFSVLHNPLSVDQSLIQIKQEKLFKAWFLKLKINLLIVFKFCVIVFLHHQFQSGYLAEHVGNN